MEPLYKLPGSTDKTFQSYLLASGGALVAASALTSWIATQYVAAQLAFDTRLGRPWWPWTPSQVTPALYTAITAAALALALLAFQRVRRGAPILFALALGAFALSRGPLYSPFHFFAWFLRWHTYSGTAQLLRSAMHAWIYASVLFAVVWLITLPIVAHRRRGMADTHGSARWADLADLKHSGLLADLSSRSVAGGRGLFLGAWSSGSRRYALYDDQPHHVFCFAPTRSGKGVGLVIPNLLNWSGSVIVHDIKAENWFKTAGWRQQAGS
ncbi:MAG: type IV secretory system conjugative DNA transfer family protein, partial [Gammaproteobacteria bacterium]